MEVEEHGTCVRLVTGLGRDGEEFQEETEMSTVRDGYKVSRARRRQSPSKVYLQHKLQI